jgi:hypothetical protein
VKKFLDTLFCKKWLIKTKSKIIKINALGVCIDKNEKKQRKGKTNHKKLFLFFIATIKVNIANKENIYECIYANGVPETG